MPTGLIDLPFEILNHIVENFDDVRTVTDLSRTAKRFHDYAQQDGFRVFILRKHPCYQKAGSWNDAIKSLTALSRAWNRKAFIARNLRPPNNATQVIRLPADQPSTVPFRPLGTQSMGYQPIIDCYESWSSGSSQEILAWGAGAELIVRLKNERQQKCPEVESKWPTPSIKSTDGTLQWISYKAPEMLDGRDDITAAKLLRPHQVHEDGKQKIILGRASGYLQYLTLDEHGVDVVNIGFNTTSVTCADVSLSTDPIVAACSDDKKLTLHRLETINDDVGLEFDISTRDSTEVTWTMRFLSNWLLALGQGTTKRPLSLIKLTPAGLVDLNFLSIPYNAPDAIYAIEPLQDEPNLFLSGHYSGRVQLNDMRIANGRAAVYEDPIDCSPVYSLLPMTGHRFIAGGARHCLIKFFDLRRPSWSCSTYTADPDSSSQHGYNIFLPTIGTRMTKTSPTYSLSAASPHATSFFAGIENGVVQIDLHSATDHRARPHTGIPLLDRVSPSQTQMEKETESLRLAEHTADGVPVLLRQSPLGHRVQNRQRPMAGYDDRWADDIGYDSHQSVRRMGRGARPSGNNRGRRRFS